MVERLDAAARRGKLAGFARGQGQAPTFIVRDFGGPFESVLEARAENLGDGRTRIGFQRRMRPGLAWVYLIVLIATVWPGVWLTDSMLRTYFTGYDYKTWLWYLPLTIPTVPWAMWVSIKRSNVRGRAEAAEVINSIAALIGGRLEGAAQVEPAPAVSQTVPRTPEPAR